MSYVPFVCREENSLENCVFSRAEKRFPGTGRTIVGIFLAEKRKRKRREEEEGKKKKKGKGRLECWTLFLVVEGASFDFDVSISLESVAAVACFGNWTNCGQESWTKYYIAN